MGHTEKIKYGLRRKPVKVGISLVTATVHDLFINLAIKKINKVFQVKKGVLYYCIFLILVHDMIEGQRAQVS